MRTISWQSFDQAVERIARDATGLRGVFGVPRGGLVLAVALSHRLELPLLHAARPGCLVVDDVYETGRTLAPYRHLESSRVVVWISKAEPQWWHAVEVTPSSEWIVFPWENAAAAGADEQRYRSSRA
jgi:hypoxanthine phosphoribosyltransferase